MISPKSTEHSPTSIDTVSIEYCTSKMAPSAPTDEHDKPSDGLFLDSGGAKEKETRQYGLAVELSQSSIKDLSDETRTNVKR